MTDGCEPITELGESIRELIANYATAHDIKTATVVGLLHCIAHEIMIDGSIVPGEYTIESLPLEVGEPSDWFCDDDEDED